MNLIQILARRNLFCMPLRSWSTTAAHLEHQINKDLENELYKPKNHPGKYGLGVVVLPERIQSAIKAAAKGTFIFKINIMHIVNLMCNPHI